MNINKKSLSRFIISFGIATLILLILGLIFIGAGHIYIGVTSPITGEYISVKMSGFEAINNFGFDTVFSNDLFSLILLPNSQLSLIKCGMAFAVILTPILFLVTASLAGYYYAKFIKEPTTEKETVEFVEEA